MYSVHVSEGKKLDLTKREVTIMLGCDRLKSDRLTIGKTVVPPMTEMVPHVHEIMEEVIYITKGCGEAIVGGELEKLEEDTVVLFPIGVEHVVKNTGRNPLEFIFVFNPTNDFSTAK